MKDSWPQEVFSQETLRLLEEETRLEEENRALEEGFAGLRDIDLLLRLARTKLDVCMHLMKRIGRHPEAAEQQRIQGQITQKALAALRLVDGLVAENVSEDQQGIIQANPLYAEVKARLEEFLMAGGGGFLEVRQVDARRRRQLSRSIAAAIRKYFAADDTYPSLELERYPALVRKVLLFLFPVMIREHPEPPPYGIEEGEEIVYSSQTMQLPLTQAVYYMENELLPELERKSVENPGSSGIQEEIRRVRERMEEYRKLRFFPRSTPVLLEKGYYTEGMTAYTADGEMLVPIPLAVSFRSGTNLDRRMELVRMDVVRRIAGRGVSRSLDREYRRLRSLESGIRGNSRTPSMKLDAAWGYRVLRQDFPFLARLSDKQTFGELVRMVRSSGAVGSERRIEALIEKDQEKGRLYPQALESDSPPDPPL